MKKERKGLNISTKSFLTAIAVLFALMLATYILTLLVPSGEFDRLITDGRELVQPGTYHGVAGGISFLTWLASPILVLGAEGGGTILAVILFLLVIGGVFNALERGGLMGYMLDKIVYRFHGAKYRLLAVVTLFFMSMGAFIGSFEECVPLVPIVVALAISLGWDTLTGMGMSLLAAGCGFAAGVCNPFSVGIAQELAGLKMFSGIWFRLLCFALIYGLLVTFLIRHAKGVEQKGDCPSEAFSFTRNVKMDRGLWCFGLLLGLGVAVVLSSSIFTAIQDFTMPVIAVTFLAAGIAALLLSGMRGRTLASSFWYGMLSIAPAAIMILLASSIKYILAEAKILDTILYGAMTVLQELPPYAVILLLYVLVLVMNFFIASGSAKAFLLIPLIIPLADLCGISRQLCVVAYAFGDGFSNTFYVTNPVLLISLGLAGVSYGKWIRFSWKFQMLNLLLTSGLLLLGLAVGYA